MKQLIKCTKLQFYLAVRLPYFWISMFLVSLYCWANIIYDGLIYQGYSAIGILTASDLYILCNDNRFWGIFSILIPFICTFSFSMQPFNDKEHGTKMYLVNRISNKFYYLSGLLCSAFSTFFIICLNVLISVISLYIMFDENGHTLQGAKYSEVYWLNIHSGYCYHFQGLHINHPVLYMILMTFIFAVFCSVISVFMYSIAAVIKKDKLYMMLAAGVMSFIISQIYLAAGYDIYGDVTASTVGLQTGVPTLILGIIMLLTSAILIRSQMNRGEIS